MADYSWFDETYYMDGEKRGNVYCDYIKETRSSELYKQIADLLNNMLTRPYSGNRIRNTDCCQTYE